MNRGVMSAALLSALPIVLLTRTQNEAGLVMDGVTKEEESVPTGLLVSPLLPLYH